MKKIEKGGEPGNPTRTLELLELGQMEYFLNNTLYLWDSGTLELQNFGTLARLGKTNYFTKIAWNSGTLALWNLARKNTVAKLTTNSRTLELWNFASLSNF